MSDDLNRPTGTPGAPKRVLSDADLDLPIQGFKGTPDEIERQWFEKIYTGRGDTPEATDLARRADGRRAGHVHVHLQPLHDAQARLGVRRGHHRVRPVVRDLECHSRASRRPVEPDDHARKQLHAVHGDGGRLFHRRHDRHRLRRAAADRGRAPAVVCRRLVRSVHGGAGRLPGHPDEAPDDQPGAVEVPQRHRRRRDAPQPLLPGRGRDEEGLRAAHRAGGGRRGGTAAHLRHAGRSVPDHRPAAGLAGEAP